MVVLTFHITRIIKGEIRPGRSLCRGERIIILLLGLISLLTGCGGLPTGTLLYESRMMMKVIRTETTIVVQNVSGDPLAIRISWDEQDHDGTGQGIDSYIDNWVTPGSWIEREFKQHTSVQVWVWGTSGDLLDHCSLSLTP